MQESQRSMVQCNDDCDCHRVVTLGFRIVTFVDRDKTFGTILRSMARVNSVGNAIFEIGLYTSNLIPLPDVKIFCEFFFSASNKPYENATNLHHQKI